jgi:putative oxidoreductase
MPPSTSSSSILIALGRCLLALYFLVPGILKFVAFEAHVKMMSDHHVLWPAFGLAVAGVAQIVGAVLLMANRFVRSTALGFVVYIALINILLHDFWHFDGMVAAHERQNFIKNLGIAAGLLILAGHYRWRRPSLGGLRQSDDQV